MCTSRLPVFQSRRVNFWNTSAACWQNLTRELCRAVWKVRELAIVRRYYAEGGGECYAKLKVVGVTQQWRDLHPSIRRQSLSYGRFKRILFRMVEQLRRPFEKFVDSLYYSVYVFEKWVERCKKCIACQGRYFEKRPSPHLNKVPIRSNMVSPRTFQTALVYWHAIFSKHAYRALNKFKWLFYFYATVNGSISCLLKVVGWRGGAVSGSNTEATRYKGWLVALPAPTYIWYLWSTGDMRHISRCSTEQPANNEVRDLPLDLPNRSNSATKHWAQIPTTVSNHETVLVPLYSLLFTNYCVFRASDSIVLQINLFQNSK
jgi:hypothetical protein